MKRLLTYLSAIVIMMMVPIGAMAETHREIYLSSQIWGWNNCAAAAKFSGGTGDSKEYYIDIPAATFDSNKDGENYLNFRLHGNWDENSAKWGIYPVTNKTVLTAGAGYSSDVYSTGNTETDDKKDYYWRIARVENATNYRIYYKYVSDTESHIKYEVTTSDPVAPTTGDGNFYLVGNFFNTDGDAINTSKKYFLMKSIGNNQYSFDIPATITAKCNIINSNGDMYGPSGTYNIKSDWPTDNNTCSDNLTTASASNNYWNLTDRGLSSDGMYTVTITVDNNGVPTNWSIKHDQLTRVAYFLPNPSEHSNATAQPCYSKRNNSSSAGSNKYFGNFYLEQGKHAYVVSNITLDADNNNNSLLKTVNKLYLQGNGGGTPETGNDNDTKVYPHQSTGFRFNNTVAITLEYNPSKGTESNLQSSDNRIGGEILKGSSNQLDITSMAVIGNGVGTDWVLNNARPMTYNSELKCWEITITTTAAESTDNLFRFVANGSWDINWYENGTAATDKARVPYTGTGDGHAATEADVNVVEKTNDAHATTARDIIFNRPAGEWTIRFFTDATSTQGGNYFSYNFYYTITGTENTDPDATLSPGTTTWDSYTLNDTKALTVTLTNGATGYKYSYGTGTTPSTAGIATDFGNLSYDGSDVKLNGTTVAAGTNTVTICIQGTDGNNDGAVHEYTYTFNPTATVTATINTAGGLYINKVLVDVAYTGDSSTPLYWKVGGAPTTSDNLVSYTDDENNVSNRKFLLSTPGQLYVGDGTNTSAPVTFDFTYSTSENYVGVEKNGTVSQIVTSKGGKDCVNVFFKKSEDNMSIYVWDSYAEAGSEYLTKVWPGQWMSDDRTLTLNGETFYYVSFPTSDLVKKNGKYKIGFILSNAALGSSDTDADKTKTRDYFLEFDATDTDVQGVQETMFYALEANVTAQKVTPEGSSYEDQVKSTYKGSAAQLFSTNTVYFKNDQNWTSPIYCHVWKSDNTSLYDWNSNNNGEMMTLVDKENKIYAYTIPADYQYGLLFSTSDRASKTGDLTFSGNGGKMYKASTSEWVDAPSSFTTLDAASQTVMNTFLTTPPVTTVESRVYPNGQDYYRNMPNDYTLMLSNEWKHETEPVDEQSWQLTSGSHWSGSTTKTYLHIYNNTAYQTVKNLPAGTYTVQALVRGGGTLPVYLDLNNTEVASIRLTTDGADAKTTINKFGRSEQLVEMSSDNGKRGWHKLEGTVTLATAGDLKIAVRTYNGGSIDLADVFLLKDANTAGNYWTTAPTFEDVTWYDMSNRTNYNAFSFFDRGKNLNSIIKANQKTVIGMSEDNEPYGESGRRHPCNVVTSSDGSTWRTPMLALTDYATVIEGSEGKYGNDTKVSRHAYGTNFAYTADKFSYDRATSKKMMSTMLPFALSNDQVKSMLGNGVKTYTLTDVDKTNLKVTFNETTSNLAAHTPFFFLPSEEKSKMALDESVSVVATSATSSPSSPAQGLLGTYKHISDVGTTYKNQNFIPYFFQNGSFVWAQDGARAKPFRVIFLLHKGGNNARMLNAIFVDDTTTGIDGITENIQQKAPVYSIDGKLVSSDGDTSRLSKGVYVKAGKKFIIK